ncbi:flagellar hook-basal body complex protein FliE [Parendozoicomonas sp. Alg238-R29]|uniref:flagellar hook-basal body complex protein FliE n=1 Tax=Parendozoicomonas sp. Alg238-R29 TaxID=2993446 RepID=UPI00248DB297|nr:flagellar hook-basal body complex protein FliE [Parendozoicomonas sp. Alg238-R29]
MSEISQSLNVAFPSMISPSFERIQLFEHTGSEYSPTDSFPVNNFQSYSKIFSHSLNVVNSNQNHASSAMAAVSQRQSDDLIGTVMAIQKASLSFQFLLQARNRFVEGYHELFNQQI